jgi:hypothetical protein
MNKEKEYRISKRGIRQVRTIGTKTWLKRCNIEDCNKKAQSKSDKCKAHDKKSDKAHDKKSDKAHDKSMTSNPVTWVDSDNCYLFDCPHCSVPIIVEENQVNCEIFRHGVMKGTYEPVHPHAPKSVCDELVAKQLVLGCCKPFRLLKGSSGRIESVAKCQYL